MKDIVFLRQHLSKFLPRRTRPIITKLCTKHPWIIGIQVCSKKDHILFEGEIIAKKYYHHFEIFLPLNCCDSFHHTVHRASLDDENSNFTIKDHAHSPMGDNTKNNKNKLPTFKKLLTQFRQNLFKWRTMPFPKRIYAKDWFLTNLFKALLKSVYCKETFIRSAMWPTYF